MERVKEAVRTLRAQIETIEDVLHGLHEQLERAERHLRSFPGGKASLVPRV